MPTTLDERKLFTENNKHLAPVVAQWFRAYVECSDDVQTIVRDMFQIISDESSDPSDKEMAVTTVVEALFPTSLNGTIGADLDELEQLHKDKCQISAEVIAQMDAQEETFANRVESCMKERGMNQTELADAIGIGQPAVSMLLSRTARPQRRTVDKIADALKVDASYLWPPLKAD